MIVAAGAWVGVAVYNKSAFAPACVLYRYFARGAIYMCAVLSFFFVYNCATGVIWSLELMNFSCDVVYVYVECGVVELVLIYGLTFVPHIYGFSEKGIRLLIFMFLFCCLMSHCNDN